MTEQAATVPSQSVEPTGDLVVAQADTTSSRIDEQVADGTGAARPGDIVVPSTAFALPEAGDRLDIAVPPNTAVRLADPAFNPNAASYAVDGIDLIVVLSDGSSVVFLNFFDTTSQSSSLSVLGGPEVTATVLLARSEAAPVLGDVSAIEPAGGSAVKHGGGAGFDPYDPSPLPPGLDPIGPLGPTSIGFGTPLVITDPEVFEDTGAAGLGEAPVLSLRSEITDVVVNVGRGFNPPGLPVLPIEGPGITIPDSEINNIPREQVTLDETRQVEIVFIDENSRSIDSLFVYEVNDKGFLVNVRPVFPFVNKVGDVHKPALLEPGDTVSIGTLEAGTEFGLLLLNDGGRQNDPSVFEGGTFELRNPVTGAVTNIADKQAVFNPANTPLLLHTADDGTVTELSSFRLFSADISQGTPNNNRLNPDDEGHFVSGFDTDTGLLVVGVEDGVGAGKDNDFDDDVFAIRFRTTDEFSLFTIDPTGGLRAVITDADGDAMSEASISLLSMFAGDQLVIDQAALDSTGLQVEQLADGSLRIFGTGTIAAYETAISAVRLDVDATAPVAGERVISATVTDERGATSEPVETRIEVTFDTLSPDDPPSDDGDVIIGTTLTDLIDGGAGDDFIDGLGGDDTINGNAGDDTIAGGSGADFISPGDGADLIRYRGLSDGKDTVDAYDPAAGDRIDLQQLFVDAGFDPSNPALSIRVLTVDADGDGASDDFQIQVDIDGQDGPLGWVAIMDLTDPLSGSPSVDGLNILLPLGTPGSTVS